MSQASGISEFEVRSQTDGAFEVVIRRVRRRIQRISGFRSAADAHEWISIRTGQRA
jgi:hypothetical protein